MSPAKNRDFYSEMEIIVLENLFVDGNRAITSKYSSTIIIKGKRKQTRKPLSI